MYSCGQNDHLMIDVLRLHRRDRLDRIFEKLLQAYRQILLDAIAHEPDGPVLHLRAHLNSLVTVVRARTKAVATAVKLLQHERYQQVWQDFVAEACADDSEDYDLASINRYTADLWYLQTVQRLCGSRNESVEGIGMIDVDAIQCEVLSLIQLPLTSESEEVSPELFVTYESHRTR